MIRDKLHQRIRLPRENMVREFFDPGRPHGVKEHVLVDGKTTEMHFYLSSRSDGLVRRVEKPGKVVEYFEEREDKITYRSVTYDLEYVREKKGWKFLSIHIAVAA